MRAEEKKPELARPTFAEHIAIHAEAQRNLSTREAAAGMRGMRAMISVYERGGVNALEHATVLSVVSGPAGERRVLSAGADPSPVLEPLSRGEQIEVEHEEVPLSAPAVLAATTTTITASPALEAAPAQKVANREVRQ
jgi:hypothetical protein